MEKLFPFIVIFLASVIAGCASPVEKLPGDKYHGMGDGVGGNCEPFEFDIAINEGEITGQASTRYADTVQFWRQADAPLRYILALLIAANPR